MVLDRVVYRAVADGDIDAVKIALANGADVNDRFVRQEVPDDTMLCVASERSHCDLVKFLLERGADPNLSDNEGADYRPLDLARDERAIDLLVGRDTVRKSRLTFGLAPMFRDASIASRVADQLRQKVCLADRAALATLTTNLRRDG